MENNTPKNNAKAFSITAFFSKIEAGIRNRRNHYCHCKGRGIRYDTG